MRAMARGCCWMARSRCNASGMAPGLARPPLCDSPGSSCTVAARCPWLFYNASLASRSDTSRTHGKGRIYSSSVPKPSTVPVLAPGLECLRLGKGSLVAESPRRRAQDLGRLFLPPLLVLLPHAAVADLLSYCSRRAKVLGRRLVPPLPVLLPHAAVAVLLSCCSRRAKVLGRRLLPPLPVLLPHAAVADLLSYSGRRLLPLLPVLLPHEAVAVVLPYCSRQAKVRGRWLLPLLPVLLPHAAVAVLLSCCSRRSKDLGRRLLPLLPVLLLHAAVAVLPSCCSRRARVLACLHLLQPVLAQVEPS